MSLSKVKIFFKNYMLVLKVALTQIIMIVAGVGILALCASNFVSDIGAQLEASGIIAKFDEILTEVVSSNYSAHEMVRLIGELGINFQHWGELVELEIGGFYYRLSLYSLIFFLWLIAVRFLNGLSNLPLNQNLNEYLGSSYKSPFFWQYFRCAGKSAKQQLLSLLYEFLADIVLLFAALGIYMVVFIYTGVWGLIVALLIFSALISFRRTATAFWLPEAVNNPDEKMQTTLRCGLQKVVPVFGKLYLKNLIVFTTTLVLSVAVLLPLKFNIVSITICLIIFVHNNILQSHIAMSDYFRATGRKFYEIDGANEQIITETAIIDEGNEFN